MSHSYAEPERAWNSGLYDQDYVALVGVHKSGEAPVDWEADKNVSYVQVGEMDETFREGLVRSTTPKGVQEGFESRLIWPSTVVSCDGMVVAVNGASIQVKRASDNRIVSYRLGVGIRPREKGSK